MANTHYQGQALATCPDCSRTIRMKPAWSVRWQETSVLCSCGKRFRADRRTGEVLDD